MRFFKQCFMALIGIAWLGLGASGASAQLKVDQTIPVYAKVAGISGNLTTIGSDTLLNLVTLGAEKFRAIYPAVNIQIEGKGSSTAPPALTEGTSQFGPMSRKMKARELEAFERRHGFKPTAVGVALDALAVYVHKDNPAKSLSLPQVDAIFSRNRKGRYASDITRWGQVGLKGGWNNLPISMYGRNSASGTYGYFKQVALFKGDYKNQVKEQPGSSAVVQSVSSDKAAIGYSGIGYHTSSVRALALAKKQGGKAYAPTYGNVLSGKYPIGRMLYIYIPKKPGKALDPLTREFMRFLLSRKGQQIVIKDGYLPLPGKLAAKQRALLD